MVNLKNMYDIAILVSGDADYIPAVSAVKNFGKHVVCVDFKKQDGLNLPGGARKLKEQVDFNITVDHDSMKKICNY